MKSLNYVVEVFMIFTLSGIVILRRIIYQIGKKLCAGIKILVT